ncbi:PQQ-binding-like beta-propeller repeat protein [Natrinema sp. H-ect4]|uniref:outer membrane protein assembly factor BamB family protein n=1 Tax=Natrinema sp. H-ect4 TaxID=3242699 RepID=UPI0035A83A54
MKRRHFFATVTTAGLAGCFGGSNSEPTDQSTTGSITELKNSEYVWKHKIPGNSLVVSHGRVLGDEKVPRTDQHGLDISGGVFSLNVQSGNHQWTYGSSHESMSGYGTPIVKDAIYVNKGNDVTSWPFAIEFDGTERWSGSESSSGPLSGGISHVIDGIAYLEDRTDVRAIDAATGEQSWTARGSSVELDTAVSDTHETVYIGGDELVARNPDDGSVQWRYEHSGDESDVEVVSDGVVYATVDREAVIAVADGELLWRVDALSGVYRLKVVAGSVLIGNRTRIYAFDATTGDQRWTKKMGGRVHANTDRVYVSRKGNIGERSYVSAFAFSDGAKIWTTEVGNKDKFQSLSMNVIEEGKKSDGGPLFVQIGREKLHRINSVGEITQTWTAEEMLHDFVIDEFLIISTDSGIYALKP